MNKQTVFKKLRQNLENYLIDTVKIKELVTKRHLYSDADIILFIKMNLKTKSIDELQREYIGLISQTQAEYNIADDQRRIIEKYVRAMIDLV